MSDVAVFVLGALSGIAGLVLLPVVAHLVLAGGLAFPSLRGEPAAAEASLPVRGFEGQVPLSAQL